MVKSLRRLLQFVKNKEKEPEDVSHHFRGQQCVSNCETYILDPPLLKAIAHEWLMRNPGIKTITELADELDIHTYGPLHAVLRELATERKITLSTRYQMLSSDWESHAEITVNDWLKRTEFEQTNGQGVVDAG